MKIAISARGPNPNSEVDESFGRAYWFIIYDEATTLWNAVDNSEIRNSHDNVGVKASRLLTELGVDVLITGETGPKAYRALSEEGIEVFHDASGTVQETYLAWQRGLLRKAAHANSQGSPYCLVSRPVQKPVTAPKVMLGLLKNYQAHENR